MVTFFRNSLFIVISSFSLVFSQNYSLSFDGVDDYVDFGNLPSGLNNFSYMGWYKFPGLIGSNDVNPIFNTPNGFVMFSIDGQSLLASAFISRDGVSPFYEVGTNNYGELNEWNHFSFTVNGSDLSLYINGELVDSDEEQSGHNSVYDLSQMGTHGRTNPPNTSFFNGSIDNFSFWSSTLTQEQIQAHMNTPLLGDEEGLVGYWNFDDGEGSTLTDLSGNGNHGTIYGATWSDDGAPVEPIVEQPSPNHSLSFDGVDDYVVLPGLSEVSPLDEFSLSVWVKEGDGYLISILDGGTHWLALDNGLTPSFGLSGSAPTVIDTMINDDWNNLIATYKNDGTGRKLYLNGHLISGADSFTGPAHVDFETFFGYSNGNSFSNIPSFYDGKIDEISFWSSSFSEDEIDYHINNTISISDDRLLGYWNFNDGEGSTLTDLSGNGNHGTIYGATWSDDGAPVQPLEGLDTIATITLSDVNTYIFPGYFGDTALVAVNADLGDIDLFSSEMHFTGFQGVLGFEGIVTEGTPMGDADWDVIVNEQEEILITGNYGSDAISGDITLFHLMFSVGNSLAEDSISIELAHVELNEEEGVIETMDGIVSVGHLSFGDVTMNDDVSTMDAANILRYLVGLVDFDKYQMSAADVTMDESISALDASVVAQYAVGLVESLPHSEGTDGQGFLTINNGLEYQPGEILEVPLMLTDGNNLLSFEVELTYDPNQVTVEGIDWSNQIDHFIIEENNEPGSIRVAGSGTTPDGQEGLFATLRLQVLETTTEQSIDLTINKIRINESAPVEDVMVSITQEVLSTDNATVPTVYALHQNYPNPFNPTTKISYDLPEASVVSLSIFDLMGREVRTMINSEQTAGFKNIQWNATDNLGKSVPAGMYIYTIQAGEFRQTRKMVLLK